MPCNYELIWYTHAGEVLPQETTSLDNSQSLHHTQNTPTHTRRYRYSRV